MTDGLCADLCEKELTTRTLSFWISYDPLSLEKNPDYAGPVSLDYYGRLHPKHTGGTVRFHNRTRSTQTIMAALTALFDRKVNPDFYVRRLGVCAEDTVHGNEYIQLDLFTDYDSLEKEKHLQQSISAIRRKYGKNAVLKGMNLLEAGTAKERNTQIGGHKA